MQMYFEKLKVQVWEHAPTLVGFFSVLCVFVCLFVCWFVFVLLFLVILIGTKNQNWI